MRILVVGAGGVGTAAVAIAARRDFFEHMVVADYDPGRVEHALAQVAGDARFSGARVDASDVASMVALIREHGITHVLNAVDPRFVMPIFDACYEAGVDYMDMAMSLSHPHPDKPYELTGEKLGDRQFEMASHWEAAGRLALVGMGVEPGLSDIFARYAQDELFSEIDEAGVRDGANLVVDGYDFAPSFSIWTTIEECLNPPVVWEEDRGWFTTPPFSEPEVFEFPGGHRSRRVRQRGARGGAAHPALGQGQAGDLQVRPGRRVHQRAPGPAHAGPGQDRARHREGGAGLAARRRGRLPARPGGPRRPDAREDLRRHVGHGDGQGRRGRGRSTSTTWWTATGPGRSTARRPWSGRRRSTRSSAFELLARGTWSGAGVLGPEAFEPKPFLDLLVEYGSPWGMREETPAG